MQIYDGGKKEASLLGGAMCGDNPPTEIISTTNEVMIKFHTDGEDSDSGYKIKIEKGNTVFQIL